jgi:hypothetical protein
MKRLDDSTLERLAEAICGGGPGYEAPAPYRTKSEIIRFFQTAGVVPRGQSSTRKWFVLESLQVLNRENTGVVVPEGLQRVTLRLANPQEYSGDRTVTEQIVKHLNGLLAVEGIEVRLDGVRPTLLERTPGMAPPKQPPPTEVSPPPFEQLVADPTLATILTFRWKEAQRCVAARAHLSAVVMMGSILEGVLLHKVESDLQRAYQAKAAPKDKPTGKPRPIHDWGLSAFIDVAHEVGWLQGDVKRFSHALRESRNIVHPYMQRLLQEMPDADTCAICWQVVRAAVADLLGEDAHG